MGIEFGVLFFEGLSCSNVIYAEMKDGVREGLHIKCKKEEKEFVSEQEEATFWEKKLLGTTSAKSLLNTIYFYNGKVERIICCPIVVVSND